LKRFRKHEEQSDLIEEFLLGKGDDFEEFERRKNQEYLNEKASKNPKESEQRQSID